MLEQKQALGSQQQSKISKTERSKTRKVDAGKNISANSSANNPGHRVGPKGWPDGHRAPLNSDSQKASDVTTVQSFSFPSKHCTPPPAPGPLPSPLLGGLPGNALLIRGQAASLQLGQLKAHLALTHINNVLAVGGRAVTPPSPTAVAINLLNLLKIANTMSHPMYNPYASGKQNSSQGQYGFSSVPTDRDPRTASPHLRSGSSFSSSGLPGGPMERDPRMTSSHLGPGSTFNSSGLSGEPVDRNSQIASPHIGPGSSFNSSGLSSGFIEKDPRMASPYLGPGSSFSSSGYSSGPTERNPMMASPHLGPDSSFGSSGLSSGPGERNTMMASPHLGPGSSFSSSGLSSGLGERNTMMTSPHLGPGSSFSSSGLSSGLTERNPLMASSHLGPGSSFGSSGLSTGPGERNPMMASPHLGPGSSFNSSGLPSGPTARNPSMASLHPGSGSSFNSSGLPSGPTERNPPMASPHLGPGSSFNSSGLTSGPTERDPRKASPYLGPGSSFSSSGLSSGPTERDPRKALPHLGPGSSFNSSGLSSGPVERDPRKASPHLGPGSSFNSSGLSSGPNERDPRKVSPHSASGSSFSSSGLSSRPTERDPRKASSHLGPGSTLSSSTGSTVTVGNTMGTVPPILSQPPSYKPERSGATDDSIERSVDLHLSRAREEVRHQSASQGSHFTSTQRDEFPSSGTGATSFLTSSASQGHSNVKSGSSSLDWLPICKKTSEDNSSKMHSSASSDYQSSGDGRFNTSGEGNCEMQSIPGLGDYDEAMSDKSVPPTQSGRPKYTSESASNILLHFGLEKEDLEHLILYPEDQITPDNLPFILRQIRIQKKSSTAAKSVSYSTTQSTTTMSGVDTLGTSRRAGINQDEISSAILKPSKVIDYGHTGKYTGGVGDEMGRSVKSSSSGSGGASLMDTFSGSSREPLQRSTAEVKSSSFVSSHNQISSVTSLSSMRSSGAPPASDPTKRLPAQQNQTSQPIFSNFSLPKKDTDMRQMNSETLKSLALKKSEPDLKSTPKTQPSCTLYRGVHPSRPGLVVIGRNDDNFNNTQTKTQGQASKVAEQAKKQQTQWQQPHKQLLQRGQALQPRVLTAVKPAPLQSIGPGVVTVPPAPPLPRSSAKECPPEKTLSPTGKGLPAKAGVFKHIPTPAMLQDYAAATPRTFPHSCVLCNKECTSMKDWLSHQNTSLHLENCRLLRTRYPHWDGEILPSRSNSGKAVKPLPSTTAQTSQNLLQQTRHENPSSHSGSRSPRRRSSLESRREKRSSRSRSRSPRQYYASEGRREKRSSRSPTYSTRHTRRSRSRSMSPWYDRPTSSSYLSRSRSCERRSSPRRRDDKWSSPRRSREQRSPPRRNDDRRLTPMRSRDRRTSTERSQPQRKRSSSAERLAKRLLETSAVQSLQNPSDLEAMVKTLAPALIAELAKIKSASSSSASAASSSSSSAAKKDSSTKVTKAKGLQKSGPSSSAKPKQGKSSPPTMVRLEGISIAHSHKDVLMAMENLGKTKSVVVFRSKQEAVVCFEKVEDAEKLREKKTINIQGIVVTVVREKDTVAKRPVAISTKKPPQQKSAKSSDSTAQTTKSTSTGKVKAPLSSGAKKTTKGKLATKAKILVSKAKSLSTKQTVKTVKAENPARKGPKSAEVRKEAPTRSGAKTSNVPGEKPETSNSKQNPKLKKPQSSSQETEVTPKETGKVDKHLSTTVSKSVNGKKTVCTSTSKTTSAAPKPGTGSGQSTGAAAENKGNAKENVAKPTKIVSDSAESAKIPEDTAKVCKQQESAKEVKDAKELKPGEALAEQMEVEPSAEITEQNLTDSKTSPSTPSNSLTATATVSPPKPQVLSSDIQQASSPESKEQKMVDAKALPTKPCDPATSTENASSKPSTPLPQSTQTTVKTQETLLKASSQVQRSKMPHSESTTEKLASKTNVMQQQAGGSSAEAALKAKQTVQGTETKPNQKDPAVEAETQKDSASTTVVLPEVATSAKTKPTAASSALTAALPIAGEKMVKQQQERTDCVQMETFLPPNPPPLESGDKRQQTKQPISSPSVATATSARSVSSETGTTKPTVNVKEEAPVPETEMSAHTSVAPKASEDVKKVKTVGSTTKTSVTSEDALPASNPALSTSTPVKSEDNAELPQLNVKILKSTNKSSTSTARAKYEKAQDDTEADFSSFDEETFNFEDFVTVDEIGEDAEDAAVDDRTPLQNQTSKEKKERPRSDVSSSARKSSTKSSKASKSSTSSSSSLASSSKSAKSSSNSTPTSVSSKHKKASSQSTKSGTKSSSATVGKTSSSSSTSSSQPAPPSQKALPSKTKPHTSSTGRSTRSPAAASKKSVETPRSHKADKKPTQSAVTASEHKVAAESAAAKTVESETKIETSEMDPPAQRQELELKNQTQNVKTNLKDETAREEDKNPGKGGEKDDSCMEEQGDGEHYQILDSFIDQTDEQMNKEEDQDGSSLTIKLGPEESQSLPIDSQILDSVEDKSKACSEECIKMDCSTAKDQPATAEEDGSEGRTELLMSDGNVTQFTDSSDKAAADNASNKNDAIDKDTNKISRTEKDGAQMEEEILSVETSKTSSDDHQISDDKKPPEETEQEAVETLDSVNDHSIAEGHSMKLETPNDQTSKADFGSTEEDEDAFQVIDSLEDQLTETELEADNKEKETKKENVTASKVDKPNEKSSLRTRTSKSEDKEKPPKKQGGTVKHERTKDITRKDKKTDDDTEETVYEVVDSVEDESVQEITTTKRSGRRRTTRGTNKDKMPTSNRIEAPKKENEEEEVVFEILDSVEDEAATDEPAITTRSTRGRREKLKDAEKVKSGKPKSPARKRSTPARDSQERNEERVTEKKDQAPPKKNAQTKKSDAVSRDTSEEEATYEILDAVEEEAVEEVKPAIREKSRRGRPKKDVKMAKKQSAAPKKQEKQAEEEEETTYQILDSVEDETVDDQSESAKTLTTSEVDGRKKPRENSPKKEEEEEDEEPMYQIVDSLEDDQVQEELMTMEMSKEVEINDKEKDGITAKDKAAVEKEDTKTRDSASVEVSKPELMVEKMQDRLVDNVEELHEEPSAGTGMDRLPKPDVENEHKPATKSHSDAATSEKKQKSKKKDAGSSLVNLDEVSDEEENYPDDTAEKEQLKRSQAATEEREREQEERKTREREGPKRDRSQGSSTVGRGRKTREKGEEKEEKKEKSEETVVEDTEELVTLDEVGEDDAAEGRGWDQEMMEGELQELVTLDEIVEEEEEEEGKEAQTGQDSQPVDILKPESSVPLDEPGGDEDKKTSRSAKRKSDEDAEDSENFVTLDEVSGTEKEEEDTPTTRTRGRLKKRSRQTPVKNSARTTTVSKEDEKNENESLLPATLVSSSTLDEDTSALLSDDQSGIQKTEVEAAGQTDVQSASAGQQPESDFPDAQTPADSVEENKGCNKVEVQAPDKRRGEFVGPEAKRSRSQSPCVTDVKLPPFNPSSPLGQEFVVPKSGFFCNLCSIFYLNENTAKEIHCSSQKHYDNLLKHYQKLEKKTSKTSTESSKDAVSDESI